jgi:haloalkane dehalogenase
MFPRALRREAAWLRDLEDGLEKIRDLPVELVWGLRDPVLGGRAVRERWLREFPGARLEEVPNAGHYLPEDRPDALVAAVRRLRARGSR